MPVEIFKNCALFPLPVLGDARGSLIAIEAGRHVPFNIARVYYIFATQPGVERGFHAHRLLNQYAICLRGSCTILVDNGSERRSISMDRPDRALELGPMIWHEVSHFSMDCVLMVLADAPYDEGDYIRNYDDFLRAAGTL